MPVSVRELQNRAAEAEVNFGDVGTLHLKYAPNRVTPGYLEQLKNETEVKVLAQTVADIVLEWDFTDSNGDTLPINIDVTMELGVPVLTDIIEAISDKAGNSRKSARRSRGG